MFRSAIERNCERFDFTIGDEPYKREWSDIEVRLFDLLEGGTLLGHLSIVGKAALRRADLFICERPALRRPLSRIRHQLRAFRRGSNADGGSRAFGGPAAPDQAPPKGGGTLPPPM
jgi:CelD/BcsL family acetyltransferase involved in cellulose biosynthesis